MEACSIESRLIDGENDDSDNIQIPNGNPAIILSANYHDMRHETPVPNLEIDSTMELDARNIITTSTSYIISKIWIWILAVFITFIICLSVFPSIAALVDSTHKGNVSE